MPHSRHPQNGSYLATRLPTSLHSACSIACQANHPTVNGDSSLCEGESDCRLRHLWEAGSPRTAPHSEAVDVSRRPNGITSSMQSLLLRERRCSESWPDYTRLLATH